MNFSQDAKRRHCVFPSHRMAAASRRICDRLYPLAIGLLCWLAICPSLAAEDYEVDFSLSPADIVFGDPDDTSIVEAAIAVPGYSSRPGAAYTHYLDFGGFTFTGNWGNNASYTPGTTPAYTTNGDATTFTTTELANIQKIWSRVAEKYAPFNVNVTTVDPAVAAGQSSTDALRQTYYDSQPRMMHTVIGGNGSWTSGGGISYVNVTRTTQVGSGGKHTNWVFSAQSPSNLQFVAEATAHEDGHGLGDRHQSDYTGTTLINEYSRGTGTGSGSQAPIMGNSYSAQRGNWKLGTAHVNSSGPTTQNDASVIANNAGLGYINDGIGHTLATATPLPLNGLNINFNTAKGVIVPISNSATPTGVANYLADYFSFHTGTGTVSITLNSGRDSITPGVADPGAMLDGTLQILNSLGTVIGTSSSGVFTESLTLSLSSGNYFVKVLSAGDPNSRGFFDMGSYFLTGSVAVPEPSSALLLIFGASVFVRRRRRF